MIISRPIFAINVVATLTIVALLAPQITLAQANDDTSSMQHGSEHQPILSADRPTGAQDQQQSSQLVYPPGQPTQVPWQQPHPPSYTPYPPINRGNGYFTQSSELSSVTSPDGKLKTPALSGHVSKSAQWNDIKPSQTFFPRQQTQPAVTYGLQGQQNRPQSNVPVQQQQNIPNQAYTGSGYVYQSDYPNPTPVPQQLQPNSYNSYPAQQDQYSNGTRRLIKAPWGLPVRIFGGGCY